MYSYQLYKWIQRWIDVLCAASRIEIENFKIHFFLCNYCYTILKNKLQVFKSFKPKPIISFLLIRVTQTSDLHYNHFYMLVNLCSYQSEKIIIRLLYTVYSLVIWWQINRSEKCILTFLREMNLIHRSDIDEVFRFI